jgi:DNA polymerase elongation subunit (family B)
MVFLQPCDWLESDSNFKYVVDLFGRTQDNEVAKVRLTGFRPYFYLKSSSESTEQLQTALERYSQKRMSDMKLSKELKLDAMRGFTDLAPVKVWKLSFPALWMLKVAVKTLKQTEFRVNGRQVYPEDIYESNLPPYIRMFHELDIAPASPVEFEAEDYEPEEESNVDVYYVLDYKDLKPAPHVNIPLYACAYDIETYSDTGNFPVATNPLDEIIQIGVSFRYTNDLLKTCKRFVFVNRECAPSQDPSVQFVSCISERQLLDQFQKCIHSENPDIISGYNTFGFDDGYVAERAKKHKVYFKLGRASISQWNVLDLDKYAVTEKKTFELASGKFEVRYLQIPGRLCIDLLLSVRREQNLDSYKLDNVATTFLRDKVVKFEKSGNKLKITTKSTRGLFVGNLVRFDIVTNTVNPYREGAKFEVTEIEGKTFTIVSQEPLLDELSADEKTKLEWSFGKDDTSVVEMFDSHNGTPEDRAKIAKYCIQDCDLVLTLMAKLDTIVNARGMADVCRVPIQYIFLRGQGIKIYSAVVYNASKRNQIIMTQGGFEGDSSYEGAIVLPPKIGMYLDQPIPVLDFNSLYPSNMIAFNLSPDTLVYVKKYDERGRKISQEGPDGDDLRAKGYTIDEISYDSHDPEGRTTCGFVQPTSDPRTIGMLPLTLDILLKKRKETRKLMETTEDESQKSVLNGLQLAYKVVANSVYGQSGSRTSAIRKIEVAACTTAAGRDRLQFAKSIIENEYQGEIVYGDTDSIFIRFMTKSLPESIKLAKHAADRITSLCRRPYKIEYEKTFYPFILFCRKRYVGMMYEDDDKKCKRKTMGVALKRRDNAPIVKDIFGTALDLLMEKRDIKVAFDHVKKMLVDVIQNKFPLEKFVITKQLRDDYKNPEQIAHRVLADRMEERDPGNKPQVGDRLSFVFVAGRTGKQGERIEHIDHVKAKNLKVDTEFYITNQIQNPLAQLFALAIEKLDGYKPRVYREYPDLDEEQQTLKTLEQKEKDLDSMLFMGASYLNKHKRGAMDRFITRS